MDFSQGSSSCAQPFWVIKASRMALACDARVFKHRLKLGVNLAFRLSQSNDIDFQLRYFCFRFLIAASLKIFKTNKSSA